MGKLISSKCVEYMESPYESLCYRCRWENLKGFLGTEGSIDQETRTEGETGLQRAPFTVQIGLMLGIEQ